MPCQNDLSRKRGDAYRILDANFNRTKEGLRVCEDIARFHLKNPKLTQGFSGVRHGLGAVLKTSRLDQRLLWKTRDVAGDQGKTFRLGPRRTSFQDIYTANAQRVKESLRVLEEFSKLYDEKASTAFQRLRFRFYELEKEGLRKFSALSCPR